jgi:Mg2+ and Co2+ transporter CorA
LSLSKKSNSNNSNSNNNSSNDLLPQYKVAKITEKGEIIFEIISIIELLKKVHARDLFSLALTSVQEYELKTKNKGRITGSTRSVIDGHTNTRRNKRSLNTAILPRKENIIVSFGSIRAVIGLGTDGEGGSSYIFDAHKPSIQLFAHSIANTFSLLYETKKNDAAASCNNYDNDFFSDDDDDEDDDDDGDDEYVDDNDNDIEDYYDDDDTVTNSSSKLSIGWDSSSEYHYDDDDQSFNNNQKEQQQQEYYHNRFQRLTGLSSPASSPPPPPQKGANNNDTNANTNTNTNTNSDNMMIQSQLQSSYIQQESPPQSSWWRNIDNDEIKGTETTKEDEITESSNDNNEKYEYKHNNNFEYEKFELIFLEEILKDVCSTYNRRLKLYEPFVDMISIQVSNEMVEYDAVSSGVHRLVPIKNSLQEFELNIQSALDGITRLLDDDDDMIGLLLTERYEAQQLNQILEMNRHESVELLLEEYARQLSNILAETIYLLKKVQSKQELVAISLDSYRNRIIRMNLYLSITGVSIASMTTVAGFYGMNIINGYETTTDPNMFVNIVTGTTISGLLFGIGCFTYVIGSGSNTRYKERLHEIEIIDGALNKMGALDYTLKYLATMEQMDSQQQQMESQSSQDNDSDTSSSSASSSQMTKDEFKQKLYESQSFNTEFINDKEVDLLFNSLDVTKDGYLNPNDFSNNSNTHF